MQKNKEQQQIKPILVGLGITSSILAVLSIVMLIVLFFLIASDSHANEAEQKGVEIAGFVLMVYPPLVLVAEIMVFYLYNSGRYKAAARWAYIPLFVAAAALVFLFTLALLAT